MQSGYLQHTLGYSASQAARLSGNVFRSGQYKRRRHPSGDQPCNFEVDFMLYDDAGDTTINDGDNIHNQGDANRAASSSIHIDAPEHLQACASRLQWG